MCGRPKSFSAKIHCNVRLPCQIYSNFSLTPQLSPFVPQCLLYHRSRSDSPRRVAPLLVLHPATIVLLHLTGTMTTPEETRIHSPTLTQSMDQLSLSRYISPFTFTRQYLTRPQQPPVEQKKDADATFSVSKRSPLSR